ncbi:hypothetical protein [Nocardioides zeae]|uniref:META domain-containing protein n=1 Tax=Nocardioides zeae TaxID=1457234 RepID=A0A6P0HL51_9ACTN|nr:hypothetical protein [Nocardioides zeae]NEN79343.1 hypothetical protein [Nocardioides zeae]
MTHPDRPDRPLLPGDVHDEDHLRRLLATAADTTPVGPPPVATMLRHHRVRRRSRLLVAAAVVVAGAGVGLATSVPFGGDPGPGAGTAAATDMTEESAAEEFAAEDYDALSEDAVRQGADEDAAADSSEDAEVPTSMSGRGGVMPLGGWTSARLEASLAGAWSVGSAPQPASTNGGQEYSFGGGRYELQDDVSTPTAATLYFGDGGTVTAWTGCEAGAGTWSVADGTVSIELTRGVPLCDDGTGLLALLAEDLRSVRVVVADDGTRTLLDEDGRLLAVLRRP